jgi:hypothetical protein
LQQLAQERGGFPVIIGEQQSRSGIDGRHGDAADCREARRGVAERNSRAGREIST